LRWLVTACLELVETAVIISLTWEAFVYPQFWSFAMRTRLVISAILIALYGAFRSIYTTNARYIVEAQLTPLQVTNDNIQYGLSRAMTIADFVSAFVTLLLITSLIFIWLVYYLNRSNPKMKPGKLEKVLVWVLILSGFTISGCKPYGATRIVEIKPNETAFVVPLVGDSTTQAQFQSVEFLADRQVAAKQVEIPVREHRIGRMPWNIEWIPTVAVIIVDRTPVTREWTSAQNTGTSASFQAFGVESSESIDFKVGSTCSALVEEQHAAEFLYYFSGKSLPEVMDENVRGFVQAELFKEFGSRTLAEARADKRAIFDSVFTNTKAHFEPLGITITSLGGSEGLIYTDEKVQKVINDNFTAQQQQVQAAAHATTQAIENGKLLDQANAQATATVVAGQAAAEVLRASGEQLSRFPALTDYELASRSRGLVPNTLVVSGEGEDIPFGFLLTSSTSQGSVEPDPLLAELMPTAEPTMIPMPTETAVPVPTATPNS
jgi:hypothetical protein